MQIEVTEVVSIEEHAVLSLAELAELSRLTEADLRELLDCGVITPLDAAATRQTFGAECLVSARAAWRLKEDFELDAQGIAFALALLDRIRELEAEVRELKARNPSL